MINFACTQCFDEIWETVSIIIKSQTKDSEMSTNFWDDGFGK